MIIFKKKQDLIDYLHIQRKNQLTIGFVPTMGALHQGHLSLVEKSKSETDITVCSIFVNPAQFNDQSDYEKYPNTIAADINFLESKDCDVLFLPDVTEIYPDGFANHSNYDFDILDTVFEGAKRPGHFNGVGKIMTILLETIQPNELYMGSKDYQQCLIVKKLLTHLNLDHSIHLNICPTLREPDGLAMSSRNKRLTESNRIKASIIYQCLISIQSKMSTGVSFNIVQKECMDILKDKGFVPEYVELADANTLEPLNDFEIDRKIVALIACFAGDIRLIDNLVIN
jgi:pantoate--beta-alanine ligase